MNTQKNAAWYRHQSWHRQTIIPALMPCSNGAWRFLPLPDRAKHKQKKARNYAGLAAFHAIRCLAVPDAESFPLDGGRRLSADVVYDPRNAAQLVDDAVGHLAEEIVRQMCPVRGHEIDGFDRAQRDHPFVGARFADHAHTESGARERMPVNHLARQTEFHADAAHLVLEQLAQRLDQFEAHA